MMLKCLLIGAVLGLSCAYAQTDEASQLILDYLEAQAAEAAAADPNPRPESVDTLRYTMTMRSFAGDAMLTQTEAAIDRPNRKISTRMLMTGGDDFETSMYLVYEDGMFSSVATFDGEVTELPFDEAMEAVLIEQFETMFTMLDTPPTPDYGAARYEGRRVYADILEGVQISVDADGVLTTMPGMADLSIGDMAFVLTGDLKIAGMVMSVAGEKSIIVLGEPSAVTDITTSEMSIYSFDESNNSAELQVTMQMEFDAFNEVLDESLFELPDLPVSN